MASEARVVACQAWRNQSQLAHFVEDIQAGWRLVASWQKLFSRRDSELLVHEHMSKAVHEPILTRSLLASCLCGGVQLMGTEPPLVRCDQVQVPRSASSEPPPEPPKSSSSSGAGDATKCTWSGETGVGYGTADRHPDESDGSQTRAQ